MRGENFGLKRRPRFMAEKRALETLKLWVGYHFLQIHVWVKSACIWL